ncbi:MAG: hypothetical protein R3C24_10120 [Cyanobacteriota/Melainabacteria group bacterium]
MKVYATELQLQAAQPQGWCPFGEFESVFFYFATMIRDQAAPVGANTIQNDMTRTRVSPLFRKIRIAIGKKRNYNKIDHNRCNAESDIQGLEPGRQEHRLHMAVSHRSLPGKNFEKIETDESVVQIGKMPRQSQ